MRALIQCGGDPEWAEKLGAGAWPLYPLANRPLLEFWLEFCVELGIRDVRILLGTGAENVEAYAGEGARWGLRIAYGFIKDETRPELFLRRRPSDWTGGLLFLALPAFPRRLAAGLLPSWPPNQHTLIARDKGQVVCLLSRDSYAIGTFCTTGHWAAADEAAFHAIGMEIVPVSRLKTYYELNMNLVAGEIQRYLQPGYYAADNSHIGYNVILPPSSVTAPPLIIGNDCRIAPLSAIGPNAVLGSHVIADRGSTLTNCVVLDRTYIGRGIEVDAKIAIGSRIVDPDTETVLDITEPWIVATLAPITPARDLLYGLVHWPLALLLCCLIALPAAMIYPWAKRGRGAFLKNKVSGMRSRPIVLTHWYRPRRIRTLAETLFYRFGLDLLPRLVHVLLGRLRLCGQPPLQTPEEDALLRELPCYYPGAISHADLHPRQAPPALRAIESRYYIRHHSIFEDIRLIINFFIHRLFLK